MKIKQTIKYTISLAALLVGMTLIFHPGVVLALGNNGCETDTAIIKCTNVSNNGSIENTGVWSLLLTVINILTAGIGIAAIAGIIYGSILYSAAGDSADKVTKARAVIRNVVIGIIAYALMYAGLNFIIPGGLFTA